MDVEVLVDRNIFKGNQAQYGAGFYSRNSNNLQLSNNIFKENHATSNGGAICLYENYTKSDLFELNPKGISKEPISYNSKTESLHASYVNNVFLNNQAVFRRSNY